MIFGVNNTKKREYFQIVLRAKDLLGFSYLSFNYELNILLLEIFFHEHLRCSQDNTYKFQVSTDGKHFWREMYYKTISAII